MLFIYLYILFLKLSDVLDAKQQPVLTFWDLVLAFIVTYHSTKPMMYKPKRLPDDGSFGYINQSSLPLLLPTCYFQPQPHVLPPSTNTLKNLTMLLLLLVILVTINHSYVRYWWCICGHLFIFIFFDYAVGEFHMRGCTNCWINIFIFWLVRHGI